MPDSRRPTAHHKRSPDLRAGGAASCGEVRAWNGTLVTTLGQSRLGQPHRYSRTHVVNLIVLHGRDQPIRRHARHPPSLIRRNPTSHNAFDQAGHITLYHSPLKKISKKQLIARSPLYDHRQDQGMADVGLILAASAPDDLAVSAARSIESPRRLLRGSSTDVRRELHRGAPITSIRDAR